MKTYTKITQLTGAFLQHPGIAHKGGRAHFKFDDLFPTEALAPCVDGPFKEMPEGDMEITVAFTPKPRPVPLEAYIAMDPGAGDESLGTIWFKAPDGTKIRLGGTFEIVPARKEENT